MSDLRYKIIVGDALAELRRLPTQSINCCVTSPPYWQLRDYQVGGQIGLEKTLDEYIETLTEIFREVRRILRDDGTLWLNMGDTYMSNASAIRGNELDATGYGVLRRGSDARYQLGTLKKKDLAGVPWRLALALQADGWYLRSDIIWAKPNPVPESVKDRPTRAHEYVFLLTKSARYYYDADAIREPHKEASLRKQQMPWKGKRWRGHARNESNSFKPDQLCHPLGKNRRSVWTIPVYGYKGQHFATFPEKLVEPCILAGCPVGGNVLDPFSGSGTALLVAIRLGRKAVGIELKSTYAELARQRLRQATSSARVVVM